MKVNKDYLMTPAEGREWNAFKAALGPIYPGYESFDRFMTWSKEKFAEYGCTDFREHHWIHNTYRVNDWPDHENGSQKLEIEGTSYPVGTFVMLAASTGEDGVTAPMVYYDVNNGEPEEGAFEGKIVVMDTLPMPRDEHSEGFYASYVVTDTNYRSGPEAPAAMYEVPDPTVNNSWNTRWDFGSWGLLNSYADIGRAKALIVLSNLTWGCLRGLYDRQQRRGVPAICIDRETSKEVRSKAQSGADATVTLLSEFFDTETYNYICFLPGASYGTDGDEYITVNCHVDAMSLTQDNGTLGALGIARYFSHVPQSERRKTILFCIDSRHFIEGFENGNFAHDPYQVWPELQKKVTVTVGLEHMGEMEGAEDYEHNTMVPTGRPEFSFMKADDNDWCARILIDAAIDSGLERADIKIDGREGNHGSFKGMVRAVQASTHRLGVCVIGLAGNWPGAHTQTFSGMQYFGEKKFADEVYVWTQVVGNLMEADSKIYDVLWSDINKSIRELEKAGAVSLAARDGMLDLVRRIFRNAEDGQYELAAKRLEAELLPLVTDLAGEPAEGWETEPERPAPQPMARRGGAIMLMGFAGAEKPDAEKTKAALFRAVKKLEKKLAR